MVPAERTLAGRETITWTNHSADSVGDLWFHLYLNAYSSNRSTHLWESQGELRGGPVRDGWSWQRVTELRQGATDLLPTLTWQRPDDGRERDYTVFSVTLPEPVPPGASLTVELAWESLLPRLRRRTGVKGDFLMLAHWFPKLGVYEGGRGWNCHQFHARTEFYSDFGTYDVTLVLPEEYAGKIGASGAPAEAEAVADGWVTARFAAPSLTDREYTDPVASVADPRPLVHDFAWTADPDYVIFEERFRFADWKERFPAEVAQVEAALGLGVHALILRDVDVFVLSQPEREKQARRYYDATCAALFFYGLWFGEYPYERITVVDPAWGGSAAGGMEYPTLFTGGSALFTDPGMQRPEGVTVHECGHQFWYGLVGNNEFEAAWLDEGFDAYTDSEVLWRVYGERRTATLYGGLPVWGRAIAADPTPHGVAGTLTGQGWNVRGIRFDPLKASPFLDWWRDQPWLTFAEERTDQRWSDRSAYLRAPGVDPVLTKGWDYADRRSYRANSYARPAVILRTLAGVVGEPAFRRGMRHYAGAWRYRHPYAEDFVAAFQEGAEQELGWFFDQLLRGTGTIDWSVEVSQRREPIVRGMFPGPDGVYAEIEVPEDADVSSQAWLYDVVVRHQGGLHLPLEIEVGFEGGERQTFTWTREEQEQTTWWRLPLEPGSEEIERVLLDPRRIYFLDTDMSDNQWYARRDRVVPARWAERAWTQYMHLLHWYSSLGG